MRDDRGRLLLRIDKAKQSNAGNYRCSSETGFVVSATVEIAQENLLVRPKENDRSGGNRQVTIVQNGDITRHFYMFPDNEDNKGPFSGPIPGQRFDAGRTFHTNGIRRSTG
ncbi:unnamed protein product [Protopolystoma xenopodis]|uniref:Immunoglobulin I-set domain-containing protein n=1 Tax=Protopolystoma xenopodis TaxID=117903 RepID=A0A448XH07_9PLAT|nr:unnamed protein product [Protopolystoma xenopodis]